jgi:hypothetical protein
MEKATENFGKVDPNSQLWSDTVTWLENINQVTDNTFVVKDLPGFCTAVFPSAASNIGHAQD